MQANIANWFSWIWKSGWVTHSARTAVAAAISFGVAGLFNMPESYWAEVRHLKRREGDRKGVAHQGKSPCHRYPSEPLQASTASRAARLVRVGADSVAG
jgi:hypothetical protein